ncbi:unnamed protein product [Brassicogethes aeneus]|uniref:Ribosome-recycling factor, mitochondrial n=1 Tax=Brassicogethes aeneus TaxID=1431903 RepID=A0A9P0ARR5_BRAAE|nr:unnamed protein product [Brassicogethes aeneus]
MFRKKLVQQILNLQCSLKQQNNLKILPVTRFISSRHIASLNVYRQPSLIEINKPCMSFTREYAKGKDKKKEKGKGKVEVNENQISEVINLDTLKNNMTKAVDNLKDDFVKNLSLRSTTGSIESLPVNIDGKQHTLQEIAQIVRKNPKTIVVNMSVFPQAIKAALKAIEKSGMNLNPQQDGTTLFIPIPPVTKEHREGLAKNAKVLFVKSRDSIKDVQNKYIKQIKRKDGVSQDIARNIEQQIITIGDGYVKQAEIILDSKIKELLGKD